MQQSPPLRPLPHLRVGSHNRGCEHKCGAARNRASGGRCNRGLRHARDGYARPAAIFAFSRTCEASRLDAFRLSQNKTLTCTRRGARGAVTREAVPACRQDSRPGTPGRTHPSEHSRKSQCSSTPHTIDTKSGGMHTCMNAAQPERRRHLVVEVPIVAAEIEQLNRKLCDILVRLVLVEDDVEAADALEHVHLPRRACALMRHKRHVIIAAAHAMCARSWTPTCKPDATARFQQLSHVRHACPRLRVAYRPYTAAPSDCGKAYGECATEAKRESKSPFCREKTLGLKEAYTSHRFAAKRREIHTYIHTHTQRVTILPPKDERSHCLNCHSGP